MIPYVKVLDEIKGVIVTSLDALLHMADNDRGWGDVRSTAIAAWAMANVAQVLPPGSEPRTRLTAEIDAARNWLNGRARREDDGTWSWESEAWDTALAVIALLPAEAFKSNVASGVAWLRNLQATNGRVWSDEVWETTLATVACVRHDRSLRGPGRLLSRWLPPVLQWLNDIPSKPSGEFVCPHYTGFLAWLYAELAPLCASAFQREPEWIRFEEKVQAGVSWIRTFGGSTTDDRLWSRDTFSNSYILYATQLLEPALFGEEPSCLEQVVRWYVRLASHGYEDAEDTGLALLALSALFQNLRPTADQQRGLGVGILESLANEKARRAPMVTRRAFIAHAYRRRHLAQNLQRFLASVGIRAVFPADLPYHNEELFERIRTLIDESTCAFVLFSKDDLLEAGGKQPRPNVVYEAGILEHKFPSNLMYLVEEGCMPYSDMAGKLVVYWTEAEFPRVFSDVWRFLDARSLLQRVEVANAGHSQF